MTFQELGGLGEFIGALAVLGSLVYIAREIRQNTNATQLSTLHASMNSAQSIFEAPTRDAELARIIRVGMVDLSELTEDETERLRWWVIMVIRAAENSFVQHQAGMLDDQSWTARAHTISNFFSAPGVREIWRAQPLNYREDFREWISSEVLARETSASWPPSTA
jgi:hypothetical protein